MNQLALSGGMKPPKNYIKCGLKKMKNQSFNQQFNVLRKRAKLKQSDVAAMFGYSLQMVKLWCATTEMDYRYGRVPKKERQAEILSVLQKIAKDIESAAAKEKKEASKKRQKGVEKMREIRAEARARREAKGLISVKEPD